MRHPLKSPLIQYRVNQSGRKIAQSGREIRPTAGQKGVSIMVKHVILSSAALLLAGSAALAKPVVQPDIGFTMHAFPLQRAATVPPSQPPNLYPLNAQFGQLPSNYNGQDQWPCYGGNTNCSSIDQNGVVVGIPVSAWSLSSCDTATPCGQIYFFYQDLTGDQTDDMILTVSVKQGSNYIFDKGPVNLGPDPYYNEVVVFSGDKAFGTQGQTGRGNGWCAGTRHTCVDPVAGLANGEVTIQVGPYQMKQKFSFYLN
jgi:hypothetical protein